jgi:hypothetical protein
LPVIPALESLRQEDLEFKASRLLSKTLSQKKKASKQANINRKTITNKIFPI